MEMDLVPLFLTFSITIYILYLLKQYTWKSHSKIQLPPGPTPLPIVGSLFELSDKPYRCLARLAKIHGPVMLLKLGLTTTVVVSSPEAAKEVLHNKELGHRYVTDAVHAVGHNQVSVSWMSNPSGLWKNLRALLKTRVFQSQLLDERNKDLWQKELQKLVTHVRGRMGSTVDIGRAAFGTSLNVIANMLFSIDLVDLDSDHGHEFRELVWRTLEEAACPNISDFFPFLSVMDLQGHRRKVAASFNKLFQTFDRIVDSRVKERNENTNNQTRHDLLHELLELNVNRRTINSLLLDLFVAGSDSTSNPVEWAMAELLQSPSSMARLREELAVIIGPGMMVEPSDIGRLPYLNAVVKETFRLYPPAPLLLPHKAASDVELGGFIVPKNSRVLVNMWAIGRDGDVWEDPELFKPERFLNSDVDYQGHHFGLIPFGSGRRICPGMPLAHRLVPLVLASLINSFEWKLADGMKPEDIDFSEKFGITVGFVTPVPAIPMPLKK